MIRAIFEKIGILYIALVIFITSVALLFLPAKLQEQLALQNIKADYGKFIGPIFILAGTYLIVALIAKIFSLVNRWRYNRKLKNLIIEKLEALTNDDMLILGEFYDANTQIFRETATLNYYDRRVKLLESYGLIYRLTSSGIGTMTSANEMSCPMPYKLHHMAWKKLNKSTWNETNI
ncbi:MAG: super-infection exclusion protein B [Sporomusaceae bacterium]|nr:super-infection exclusion protein B [Sporomusaceae bacterium]